MWGEGLARADFGRDPRSSDSLKGIAFPKKDAKLLTKFPRAATSGCRHNSAGPATQGGKMQLASILS